MNRPDPEPLDLDRPLSHFTLYSLYDMMKSNLYMRSGGAIDCEFDQA